MSDALPPNTGRTGRNLGRLVGVVAGLIVIVVVAGVLLFHFSGSSTHSGSNAANSGNVSSPGPGQPGPTDSPSPGARRP